MKESFRAKHNNNSLTITTALHSTEQQIEINSIKRTFLSHEQGKKTKRENLNDLSFHESGRDVRY